MLQVESREPVGAAPVLFRNGAVLTMDGVGRRAESLLVRDGRIVAVGQVAEVRAAAGGDAPVEVDLDRRALLPGFVETHTHPLMFGQALTNPVDPSPYVNDSLADVFDRIAEAARDTEPGQWIVGIGYDHERMVERRHPTRAEIDRLAPNHPVFLLHACGHLGVANSRALGLAGFVRGAPDPKGGVVQRDARGEPTGLLLEQASHLLYAMQPPPDVASMATALTRVGEHYARHGITTFHDLGVGFYARADELLAYRAALGDGRLPQRVHGYLWDEHFLAEQRIADRNEVQQAVHDSRFVISGMKLMCDGSIPGRTGYLSEGYLCDPDEHGMMVWPEDELGRQVCDLDDAGWQLAIHGNGDAAIEALLRAFSRLGRGNGSRHRIEHCQAVREDQLDRMAASGVAASFFIKHVHYWGDLYADSLLGEPRAGRISPLRSAQARGVRFGLHSDSPITPVAPLEGIWTAAVRRTASGRVLGMAESVDVETALRAYTSEAAYLGHHEDQYGSLEVGKQADLVVLSADPTAVEPGELRSLEVDLTVAAGRVIHDRLGLMQARS